jgi:glycosyltransferase involved in cell wall biosynthesis
MMHKIAICVCTLNRPTSLRALLESIANQRLVLLRDEQIQIIVVDNSRDGSAAERVGPLAPRWRFPIDFVHEPRQGLCAARNRAIASARAADASHIAFIDDDELAHPSWLDTLFASATSAHAAAAIGPVIPLFERRPPAWLPADAYQVRRRPQAGLVDDGYTGNTILAMSVIDNKNLRFDHRFDATGGEDTFFFKELLQTGASVVWADQAIAYTVIPRRRMTARWLWLRWYRTGDIEAHLGKFPHSSPKGRLFNLAQGVARILVGAGRIAGTALFKAWRQPDAMVASFYTACRGAGLIASALGHRYTEYQQPTYR